MLEMSSASLIIPKVLTGSFSSFFCFDEIYHYILAKSHHLPVYTFRYCEPLKINGGFHKIISLFFIVGMIM